MKIERLEKSYDQIFFKIANCSLEEIESDLKNQNLERRKGVINRVKSKIEEASNEGLDNSKFVLSTFFAIKSMDYSIPSSSSALLMQPHLLKSMLKKFGNNDELPNFSELTFSPLIQENFFKNIDLRDQSFSRIQETLRANSRGIENRLVIKFISENNLSDKVEKFISLRDHDNQIRDLSSSQEKDENDKIRYIKTLVSIIFFYQRIKISKS